MPRLVVSELVCFATRLRRGGRDLSGLRTDLPLEDEGC